MKRENTRRKIISAAFELFSEKSYHDVSVEEIAKKAGLSKGGLFHYFPSKYELARTVLSDVMDKWLKRLERKTIDLPPEEKLRTLIDAVFELITENPKLSRFFLELYEESLKFNRANDWDTFYKKYIRSVSRLLCKAGIEEPEKKAILLGALVDGLALHHLLSGGRLFNVDEMKREVLKIVGE